jgi:cell division protein FtsA
MLEICAAGVVVSGGGSRLAGLLEIAESVLRKPVRLAWPLAVAKMPTSLAEPEFTTVLGMALYGHRARTARGAHEERWSSKLKAMLVGKEA